MVAKGMKRKVGEVTSEADLAAESCVELANNIAEKSDVPADVVTLLKDILPHSLGQPKDKRHRFQEQAILAVDRVIQSIEEKLRNKIETAKTNLTEAAERAAPCETAVTESDQKLSQDSARFDNETKVLAKATLDYRAAQTAVEDAKKAQEEGDKELKSAAAEKSKLRGIIDDFIEPMKAGIADDVEEKAKTLKVLLSKLEGFDEAMLMVLGSSLSKKPEVRGGFDHMAIDQLDKYMAKHIEPLDATTQAGEGARQQREATVRLAEEALAKSLEAQKSRADVFESSWNAKKEDERALEAARQGLKDLAAQTKLCGRDLHSAEVERDVFVEYSRKPFESLRARMTPPEPEVEKAEMEAMNEAPEEMKLESTVVLPEAITA
jgi:hypothetical protein